MNKYKSSAMLKADAKEQLFGKYGTCIGATVIIWLFTMLLTFIPSFLIPMDSIFNIVIYYLVAFIISLFSGIFVSGQAFFYLKISCGQPVSVGDIFFGFRSHPDKALLIQMILSLIVYACLAPSIIFSQIFAKDFSAIWMLLFSAALILGMIIYIWVSLLFSQTFYLLQDFPSYSTKQLLKMSGKIMKGHKGRLFYIGMSFLPLYLLGILSCCIAFLWITPYMNAVMANFYMDIVKNRNN